MSQGVYVLGGKCPGGECLGGKCLGGICPWGKCPGGICPGGLCPRTHNHMFVHNHSFVIFLSCRVRQVNGAPRSVSGEAGAGWNLCSPRYHTCETTC